MALRALIIANGTFDDPEIGALQSPVSDARRLEALLSRADVGPYEVDVCADLDSYAVRQAVERFFRRGGFADRQLLFFSGHGFKHGHDGRLYFGTKDTKRETMRSSSLSARFVFEEASISEAQQTMIFIDSCYSGAFVKGHTLKASDHTIARDDFEVDGAHGIAVITASSSVQTAAEIFVNDYCQSVFTKHLIDGIESGKADTTKSGAINLNGIFSYIRDKMREDAPGQQPKPHYFGLDGSVVVTKNPVKRYETVHKVVLPRLLMARILSKNADKRLLACSELYLNADKNPLLLELVRTHLKQLACDRDDHVKIEAQHQLGRLDGRFPAFDLVEGLGHKPESEEGKLTEPVSEFLGLPVPDMTVSVTELHQLGALTYEGAARPFDEPTSETGISNTTLGHMPRKYAGILWAGVGILTITSAIILYKPFNASSSATSPSVNQEINDKKSEPTRVISEDQVTLVARGRVAVKITDSNGIVIFDQEMMDGQWFDVPLNADRPRALVSPPDRLEVLVGGVKIAPFPQGRRSLRIEVTATALRARLPLEEVAVAETTLVPAPAAVPTPPPAKRSETFLPAPVQSTGSVVRTICNTGPHIVFFDWDSDVVTPDAAQTLNNAALAYRNCEGAMVSINGYTDREGRDNYNITLSNRMAHNVRNYLIGQGIPSSAISTRGFGETQNRVPTPDGFRNDQNRRVEITYGPR